jgi:aryl-alcohol dehydrogenase-like predicted oxidoreductase
VRYLNADTAKPVSKVGLGTWQFGSPEWGYGERYADKHAKAIVRRAMELGITLFDTAEIYGVDSRNVACKALVRGVSLGDPTAIRGFGRGERILGEALGDHREAIFVATKFYPSVPFLKTARQRAKHSAERLGVGRIDLYQVHRPRLLRDPTTSVRALKALCAEGTVSEVGLSNASLDDWQAAARSLGVRIISNQLPYNLVDRSPEDAMIRFAEAHGRFVIAYSPLARGLLSGGYNASKRPANAARASDPLFLPENLALADNLFAALRDVASAHSATPAQIALAWVIRHEAVAAIPGAASVEQLEMNAAAVDITLADDERLALELAADQFRQALQRTAVHRRPRAVRRVTTQLTGHARHRLGPMP